MTLKNQKKCSWLASLAAALLVSTTAVAQVPTGGFQLGDAYIWSSSMHMSSQPTGAAFQGLVRVDGITGATSLVKQVGGIYSNITYDPFRDRLMMSMELTYTPYLNGLFTCDAAGNLTKIPLPFLPFAVFSAGNGNVYLTFNNGAWTELYYLDSSNTLHGLLNAAGTGNQHVTAPNSGRWNYYYDAGTNSILVFGIGSSTACGGPGVTAWVDRISLTPNGGQVIGAVTSQPLCTGPSSAIAGVSRGPGDKIALCLNTISSGIQRRVVLVDPVTLGIDSFAATDYLATSAGTYSQIYQSALMLDTFFDNIRMFHPGQTDAGVGSGIIFTPNTSDPMVSSPGGSAEIVFMTTIDYGNSGYLAYGAGSSGCTGPETIAGMSSPKAGTTSFRFVGSNAPANSLGLVLVSDVPDFIGNDVLGIGVILYLDLINSTQLMPFDIYSDSTGHAATNPIAIPASMAGQTFYGQGVWYWTTCSLPPLNLSTTNGLEFTIQ
ncbi:MAG: hypothetical protein HY286_00975 [Planctomycetes bacterium]|nr:hypothetical protein [Planctomycetota bacterium]